MSRRTLSSSGRALSPVKIVNSSTQSPNAATVFICRQRTRTRSKVQEGTASYFEIWEFGNLEIQVSEPSVALEPSNRRQARCGEGGSETRGGAGGERKGTGRGGGGNIRDVGLEDPRLQQST